MKREERTLQRTHGSPGGKGGLSPVHGAGYELNKDDILKYFKIVDKSILDILEGKKAPPPYSSSRTGNFSL